MFLSCLLNLIIWLFTLCVWERYLFYSTYIHIYVPAPIATNNVIFLVTFMSHLSTPISTIHLLCFISATATSYPFIPPVQFRSAKPLSPDISDDDPIRLKCKYQITPRLVVELYMTFVCCWRRTVLRFLIFFFLNRICLWNISHIISNWNLWPLTEHNVVIFDASLQCII